MNEQDLKNLKERIDKVELSVVELYQEIKDINLRVKKLTISNPVELTG